MIEDTSKRLYIKSTKKRIAIFTELVEQEGVDRCDLLNKLIFQWVIDKVEKDLKQVVSEVYGY